MRKVLARVLFPLSFLLVLSGTAAGEDIQYETQILEPTGGNIDRPKNWFFLEAHDQSSWLWIFSREKPEGKPYEVGMRIQAIPSIQEISGKTPKQFILDFKAQKKNEVDKVLRECAEINEGLFVHTCLEAEEGRYQILYSLFWGNEMDIVVVTISGAPKNEWARYKKVFERMSGFELIDVNRFIGQ